MLRGRKIVASIAVALVLLGIGELYTRTPDAFDVVPIDLPSSVRHLTLVFHGSHDNDNPVFDEIAERIRSAAAPAANTAAINYDWSSGADNRARAAANAARIGQVLGELVAGFSQLESIHLIAHSSGAYIPDALCSALRSTGTRAIVRMTFLDPFGLAGLVDWTHGYRNHGRCADFALAVVNLEDPAPATDRALRHAYNIDVTADPRRRTMDRNGHYWPPVFYRDESENMLARFGAAANHEGFPRGAVERWTPSGYVRQELLTRDTQ